MRKDIETIIKQIQNNLTCPICRRKFMPAEIKLKGVMGNIIIFNISCRNQHPEMQTIHIVMMQKNDPNVNNINLTNIYKQIEEFDGDFIKLWKK
jgi:hypothetical protein